MTAVFLPWRRAVAVRHRLSVTLVAASTALVALSCRGNQCEPTNPGCAIITADVRGPEPSLVFHSNRFGPFEIFTMNSDGTDIRRLTNNPGQDLNPRWSPDGTRIVFASVRGGAGREIFVMNADGSDQRRVTTLGTAPHFPDWSPDGAQIAFHAARGDGNFDVFVMNADGSNVRRLTTRDSQLAPRWSPDGTRVATVWNQSTVLGQCSKIAVMNADGSGMRILTKQGMCDTGPADWSPDGRQLVFASMRPSSSGWPMAFRIAVVNADGTGERLLAMDAAPVGEPSWSRSTGRIYFVNLNNGGVYSMRADGSDLRRASLDLGVVETPPVLRIVGYRSPHAR